MGPFDDQLLLDVTETGNYADVALALTEVAAVSVQETGVQTVFAGQLSLVARDARIAIGFTQLPIRPQEGGQYIAADGLVWQIVSVVKHSLASYWEITGRNFTVPGGLTERGYLQRRNSGTTTTKGLNNPTWASLETSVPCLMIRGPGEIESGETPIDTIIRTQTVMQGYREIRAGDRFFIVSAPTTYWDVDGAEPYDPSIGVQVLNLRRSV